MQEGITNVQYITCHYIQHVQYIENITYSIHILYIGIVLHSTCSTLDTTVHAISNSNILGITITHSVHCTLNVISLHESWLRGRSKEKLCVHTCLSHVRSTGQ